MLLDVFLKYSLDETGLEKVPVPKFFWKIVYDEKTKKGIAVIGTNNIHRWEFSRQEYSMKFYKTELKRKSVLLLKRLPG